MNEMYPVYTLKNECHDCYRCVRECQVKAIKIHNGHASVIDERCIACGKCVTTCPSNAKRVRCDIEKVKKLFIEKKKVFVSLAPSWAGLYDIPAAKMIAILKKLGFYAVSETALGAQEVSIQTTNFLNKQEKGLFISSACPVIVNYIKKYKPEFTKNITPVASPVLTHAKLLKETFGADISVVFIGPCIAKKLESDAYPDLLDAALTFENLNWWIKEEFIETTEIKMSPEDTFVPNMAYEGALYPIEGGMNETIKKGKINTDTTLINISGLQVFENALTGLKPEQPDKKIFIEALSCSGGCINGPAKASAKSSVTVVSDILSNIKFRKNIPETPLTLSTEEFTESPAKKNQYSAEEIDAAMAKIGKTCAEDELNCGGCGYPTCRELAAALIAGDAEPSMCLSYMRKIAIKKSAALFRCMPSAVVMVDKNLKILEANDAFMHLFTLPKNGILEAGMLKSKYLPDIISFADLFQKMLKTGVDIHKEHYPVGEKLYDINAFTIEQGEIVGAIITDVTKNEMDREKIAKKAREVINKNIAKVQEIACILGEHMVETEVLLSSIAEDYSNTEKEGEE